MRNLAAAMLAVIFIVAACGETQDQAAPVAPEVSASDALHALFDEHFERNLELNPLSATFIGDYRYNDRMANSNIP